MSDFKAKMHLIPFRLGFRPRPRWALGELIRRSPSGFKGPTSKGRDGGTGSHIGFDGGNVGPPTKCNCRYQLGPQIRS